MSEPESEPVAIAERDAEIVARAGTYYRWARYVIVLMCLGSGAWFLRDGFIKWPAEVMQDEQRGQTPRHSARDIFLNKALGVALPPLGVALLIWTLYNSRGAYRLAGTVLSVPGHPAIPLQAIRRIDKRLWERKGIAMIEYELEGGAGRFRLDDFVYQREPTDKILARIEELVGVDGGGDGGRA